MINHITAFNRDFCHTLEFHLSRTFRNAFSISIKYFWCDGIAMPENGDQLSKEVIERTKQLTTTAYMGSTGQDIYDMIICFGPCALDYYLKDYPLNDCLPSDEDTSWIDMNTVTKVIKLNLL